MAVAYIGRHLGVPVTIVVPETTSQEAIQRIKDEKAIVIVHGKVECFASHLYKMLKGLY